MRPTPHTNLLPRSPRARAVCKDDGHCVAFYRGTCPAEHVIQTCFPALPCNYIALCGDDTCTRRHLCPKGIACELVHHDVVHVQRELHICASGPGCAVTDPRHRLEYLHPCLTQSKVCVQSGDELHRSTSLHKCKFGRGCRFANRWLEAAGKGEGLSPGDADHVRRFVHVCPLPAGTCTDETLLHRLQFQHVCPNGAACAKLQTASDLAHLMFMVHEAQSSDPVRAWSCTNEPSAATVLVIGGAPASSSPFHGGSAVAAEPVLPPHVAKLFARLTAHDVDMLTPVVSDVLWGARQPVLVQGRPGELLGVCAKLPGQCLVEFVSDTGRA